MQPIGRIRSCFAQKFGIPRQPRLAPAATAVLELLSPWDCPESVRGLDAWSHLWLIFQFHQHVNSKISATVRPPRLGGNTRVGVFATRSSFRPNHLGMSAVALQKVDCSGGRVCLHISGVDILDGTPVYDIKPYVAYSDCIAEAKGNWDEPPESLPVVLSAQVEAFCAQLPSEYSALRQLICQVLQQDPRPAYHHHGNRLYHLQLWEWELAFRVDEQKVWVDSIFAAKKAC